MSEEFAIDGRHGKIAGLISTPTELVRGTVLCVHGNPAGDMHGNENIFDQMAASLSARGYVVVQFSLYGSAPSSGNVRTTSILRQLEDYKEVLQYTKERFSAKLHVIGESAGATLVAMAWDQAIVSYVMLWPAFDLRDTDLRPYLSPEWQKQAEKVGFIEDGSLVLGKEYLDELRNIDFDPLFKLPAVAALLMHGRADAEVPFEQSLRAVRESRGPTTLVSVPDGQHGLKRPADRMLVMGVVQAWFDRQ